MAAKKSEIRFKRILALGPERMAIINTALAAGEQPKRIARRIKSEWNTLTDIETSTLAKQLARYRAEIIPTLVVPVAPATSDINQQAPALQVHDRLCDAIQRNGNRLEQWIEKERAAGFPNPAVSDLIKTQSELLCALAKLQFELGILEYKGPVGRWR